MGTGEIRDFTKPAAGHNREGITTVNTANPVSGAIEILDDKSRQKGVEPIVTVHEEIILEGDTSIRRRKKVEGEPEIKMRVGKTQQEWERVKRLEDA
jgi:hypothetical protein